MAGGITVAIYPTELAETVRCVLGHSEAKLMFVGKLDTWEQQAGGVPEALPRIAFPLAPPTPYDQSRVRNAPSSTMSRIELHARKAPHQARAQATVQVILDAAVRVLSREWRIVRALLGYLVLK